MSELRGITWNHTRGFLPMLATAQRFSELHPGSQVSWKNVLSRSSQTCPSRNWLRFMTCWSLTILFPATLLCMTFCSRSTRFCHRRFCKTRPMRAPQCGSPSGSVCPRIRAKRPLVPYRRVTNLNHEPFLGKAVSEATESGGELTVKFRSNSTGPPIGEWRNLISSHYCPHSPHRR
jgi:hypothetical protein